MGVKMRSIMDGFISRYKYRSMESLLKMDKDWVIVCSQSLNHYVHCICGHRVKRITYLYHKPSKAIQYVGKTCVRKYGIEFYLTNPILLDVIKANLHRGEWDRDSCVRHHIHTQYTAFMTLVKEATLSNENIMNTVVAPFRRLLSDVCDLVSEYGFDLVDILRDIEEEVESLNQATRHQMVDEYSLCDTISEIASEHSMESENMLFDTEIMEENGVIKEFLEPCVEPCVEPHVEQLVEQVLEQVVEQVIEENLVIKENVVVEENPVIKENVVVEENPVIKENVVVDERPVIKNSLIQNNFISTIVKCHCFMSYCNCNMEYNLRRLHERIDILTINIRNVRKESDELVLKTRELKIVAKECLDKAIEISSKYNIK